jgi:hypothetical protein
MSLSAKGAVCRMRMSGHEDRGFRWHIGDLNDITALGTAAGYCDVVVAENHWGSILRRHAAAHLSGPGHVQLARTSRVAAQLSHVRKLLHPLTEQTPHTVPSLRE